MKPKTLIAGMFAIGLAAGLAAPSFAADNAGAEKTVTLSTGIQFPPMEYVEDGKLIGFDIDLGNALGERAGVKIKWQRSAFSQFISDVKSGRTDGVMGGMSDEPEREESLTFLNYLKTGYQFFTNQATAAKFHIKDTHDLCGLTVAASRNVSYAEAINDWSKANCGGKDIKVLPTDGSPDARLQLKQGRAQAVMQSSETAVFESRRDPQVVLVGEAFPTYPYGIGFARNNTQLRDLFAKALSSMLADGSYHKIAAQWGLEKLAIDKVEIDSAKSH